ncbi:hypothetical protein FSARC_7613 [Fusarium sarcochroum]|uniref:Uncharacterized protein n=1 Tax=Fusarium sarcochroum TaxID=1208366 RepID=A0A8H4X744_9HYPO|nr:hypothetical protein FSARC_7613 [Fusarium sarcochroum]
MKFILYIIALTTLGTSSPIVKSIFEINAEAVGGSHGRPKGHETTPYVKNLPDPYLKYAEDADPKAVLGED